MTTQSRIDALSVLKEQIKEARDFLEGTLKDVTQEQAVWHPSGKAIPIAGHYAHVLIGMDASLHGFLKGSAPLFATSPAGKTGFDQAPPQLGTAWDRWARSARFDLARLRDYAQAVYESTDHYLADLEDSDLARALDLTALGIGERNLAWFLSVGWVANPHEHCGEIACLKGLQGLKGYPA